MSLRIRDSSIHTRSPEHPLDECLTFGSYAGLTKALGGLSKTLGSALSSKMGGGQSSALGSSAKSSAASGGKAMGAGGAQGSKPAGLGKTLGGLSSRLGGDSQKGKFSGLLSKLGDGLKGALGGGQTGKQGTGVGDAGGEGGGAKAAGGGITSTALKGISSRVGGDENAEPTAGILSGLSGKLIDKSRGNGFLNSLMDKAGGSEALKEKAKGAIAGLDTGAITQKITGYVEGDEQHKGLINIVKEKVQGVLQKKTPVAQPIGVTSQPEPEPQPDATPPNVIASNLHQGKVFITVKTPLGADTVVLTEFKARERISDLFECTALFISDHSDLDLGALIGKSFTVGLVIDDDEEQKGEEVQGPITKAKDLLNTVKKTVGLGTGGISKKIASAKQTTFTPKMTDSLSFGSYAGLTKALGGLSKTLGSALSSKMGGGQSSALGNSAKSSSASGGQSLNAGGKQGSKFAAFGKVLGGLSSRLGGDSEKGKDSGLLGKLGGGLKGKLGGSSTGKLGTETGDKGGEGGGAASGGGGITTTLLKGVSSRFGGDENAEPTAGALSGLSGKFIDKARGNEFLNGLMDKVGGSEALKEKVKDYINGLDTGAATKKLTGLIEGDEKNKGLINVAKEKIIGLFKKNQPVTNPMNVVAQGGSPRRPAFGDTQFPKEGLDQRDPNITIRYFNGIVGEIIQGPTEQGVSNLTMYTAKIYPKLWLLKHTKNCRIFQKMTAMEIIGTILKENNITDVMDKTKTAGQIIREYCVQYNESHFDFISRLMEFEGIFYYFIHTENSHVLVLADAPEAHHMCPQTRKAYMEESLDSISYFNCIQSADVLTRVVPGEHALTDYDFELPRNNLFAKVTGKGYGGRIYEYPGNYRNKADGDDFTRMRIEADELPKDILYGASTIPFFETGAYFTLSGHIRSDANKKYVIAEVEHYASQQLGNDEEKTLYENTYIAFDYDAGPLRPSQKTPKPKIHGTQTARVTGKEGEEIWTDEYGRVKVHFHWDENDKEDENTSCWVRISQGWAGNGWGMLFTPRIGHEVVVTFINGDPDQPLITGSVYNGEKLPPYLPDAPTVSTIKSKSSKDSSGFNEIRFQDLADEEEVYIRAEKDMLKEINNDSSTLIHRGNESRILETGSRLVHLMAKDAPKTERAASREIKGTGNDTLILEKGSRMEMLKAAGKEKGNYTTVLKKGDRSLTLEKGNENIFLKHGNRSINLAKGDESRTINGDFSQQVSKDYSLEIAGNLSINVAGDISINGMNLSIRVGENSSLVAGQTAKVVGLQEISLLSRTIRSRAVTNSLTLGGIQNEIKAGGTATLEGAIAKVTGGVVKIG